MTASWLSLDHHRCSFLLRRTEMRMGGLATKWSAGRARRVASPTQRSSSNLLNCMRGRADCEVGRARLCFALQLEMLLPCSHILLMTYDPEYLPLAWTTIPACAGLRHATRSRDLLLDGSSRSNSFTQSAIGKLRFSAVLFDVTWYRASSRHTAPETCMRPSSLT
jgi:hypothetical protein